MGFFKTLKYFTLGLGLFKIGEFGYWSGNEIYRRYYEPPVDLVERYGPCYAMITGATSGLGKEYAIQLAKKGFNIVLVSRDEKKLHELQVYLQSSYGVQVEAVQLDFTKSADIENYQRLYDQVKDLDIGVIINNVGVYQTQRAGYSYPQEIKDMLLVNTFPITFISNYFIPKLLQREKRSCLLTVGSEAGDTPSAYMSIYSATKAFDNQLSRSISAELGDKLDVITTTPGPTSTNIFGQLEKVRKQQPTILEKLFNLCFVSQPEDVVRETLHRVGNGETHISGTWKHELYETLQVRGSPLSIPIKAFIGKGTYDAYGDRRVSNIPPKKVIKVEDTEIPQEPTPKAPLQHVEKVETHTSEPATSYDSRNYYESTTEGTPKETFQDQHSTYSYQPESSANVPTTTSETIQVKEETPFKYSRPTLEGLIPKDIGRAFGGNQQNRADSM